MYEFRIICDFRENFESKTEIGFFNDHQDRDTFERINQAIINLGYNSKIWGGVPELGKAYAENKKFNSNTIFINLSDGLNTPYSRIQIPVFCDLLNLSIYRGRFSVFVKLLNIFSQFPYSLPTISALSIYFNKLIIT